MEPPYSPPPAPRANGTSDHNVSLPFVADGSLDKSESRVEDGLKPHYGALLDDSSRADKRTEWWRWWQLLCGILCMMCIASIEYAWTLFVDPIVDHNGWDPAATQVTLTILIMVNSWLMPFTGVVIDKVGPRKTMIASGLCVGLCWVLYSVAESLWLFYIGSVLGGIGIAGVYGGTIGNALKWFPDRRGLAAGLTAAGYGGGSAITITPIDNMIVSNGYKQTFLIWGIAQGAGIILFGLFLRVPRMEEEEIFLAKMEPKRTYEPKTNVQRLMNKCKKCGPGVVAQKAEDFTLYQTIKTPLFWLFYITFLLAAIPGLIATGQLAPFAKEFKISDSTLALALTVDRVLNGVSRPISGWVSDTIGREELLFIAFIVEGLGFLLLYYYGSTPTMFVLVTGMLFFAYGEIFSLYPASLADTFGRKYVTSIYGMIYTAKGVGSALIPVTDLFQEAKNSWKPVILMCYIFAFVAAAIIAFITKPLKNKFIKDIHGRHPELELDGDGEPSEHF